MFSWPMNFSGSKRKPPGRDLYWSHIAVDLYVMLGNTRRQENSRRVGFFDMSGSWTWLFSLLNHCPDLETATWRGVIILWGSILSWLRLILFHQRTRPDRIQEKINQPIWTEIGQRNQSNQPQAKAWCRWWWIPHHYSPLHQWVLRAHLITTTCFRSPCLDSSFNHFDSWNILSKVYLSSPLNTLWIERFENWDHVRNIRCSHRVRHRFDSLSEIQTHPQIHSLLQLSRKAWPMWVDDRCISSIDHTLHLSM